MDYCVTNPCMDMDWIRNRTVVESESEFLDGYGFVESQNPAYKMRTIDIFVSFWVLEIKNGEHSPERLPPCGQSGCGHGASLVCRNERMWQRREYGRLLILSTSAPFWRFEFDWVALLGQRLASTWVGKNSSNPGRGTIYYWTCVQSCAMHMPT